MNNEEPQVWAIGADGVPLHGEKPQVSQKEIELREARAAVKNWRSSYNGEQGHSESLEEVKFKRAKAEVDAGRERSKAKGKSRIEQTQGKPSADPMAEATRRLMMAPAESPR